MASSYDPQPGQRPPDPNRPGVVSDPDVPSSFGPDVPNVRDDDPPTSQTPPLAAPPSPPSEPLDEADFAPDEG